ncbi:MAG: ATP F0F1 synthase subunit B [Pseudomonadota bacterium]
MSLLLDSNFVVLVSFLIFVGVLWYAGVHKLLGSQLDARADRIRHELDEARRLREEAQRTFAEFERRRSEVDGQAEEIIAHAKAEAERAAEKAKADLALSIERRLRAAEEQIALAEATAVKEVKDRAIAIAVDAAAEVMRGRITGETDERLVGEAIGAVEQRLN